MRYVNCNLCQKDKNIFLFTKDSANIVKCANCGLIYVNPQPAEEDLKKKYAGGYFDGSDEIDYFAEKKLYAHRFQERMREINSLAPKKGKLLDIGCALGYFLETAKKEGWEAFGVEISPFASKHARESGLDVFAGTVEKAGYEDESFDAVTLWHVLEHMEDPSACLKEVRRILKKSGLVALEVPNAGSKRFEKQKQNWEYLKPKEHLFYFTREVLRKMVEKAGFKIARSATVPAGTRMGKSLDNLKFNSLKNWLISIFDYTSWARRGILYLKKTAGADDIILMYAHKD